MRDASVAAVKIAAVSQARPTDEGYR